MKSIFEIHDGDSVEPEYSIPGYEITVRPSRATQNKLVVFRPGGVIDAELTVGLRRFDGMPWYRGTMIKIGMWLQEQEAIRLGLDAFDRANAGGALPGLQEAVDAEIRRRNESREDGARSEALAFFNEVLAESGVVVESVSVEALGDAVRLVGVAADGSPFEAAVPHRTVRSRDGLARVPNDRHDRTDKPDPPPLEDFVWEAIRQMFPAHVQRYDLRAGTLGRALVDAGRAYERACRGE